MGFEKVKKIMIFDEYVDELYMGSFTTVEDDELLKETKMGSFSKNYDIYVYGKEGKIPHFHVINRAEKFECCVCIYEAKYFDHGNKRSRPSSKSKKDLQEYMSSVSTRMPPYTNWQLIENAWLLANFENYTGKERLSPPSKQPNYSKMTESVHK